MFENGKRRAEMKTELNEPLLRSRIGVESDDANRSVTHVAQSKNRHPLLHQNRRPHMRHALAAPGDAKL